MTVKKLITQRGSVYDEKQGIGVFRARAFIDAGGVEHGFTARKGGVSAPPFDTLNFFSGKGDAPGNVRENYIRLCNSQGLNFNELCTVSFEHGANVMRVGANERGRGFDAPPLPPCDGLITNDPGVTLVTNHADCGCFFLYDPVKRAVGIAHAGWKGTLLRIGGKAVRMMKDEFGSDPKDIIASTGPCICQKCYEVDEELAALFEKEFSTSECAYAGKPGKAQLSLEVPAAIQLMDEGVQAQNITLMETCTFENEALLFSHRRDRKGTGDMAGFINLV